MRRTLEVPLLAGLMCAMLALGCQDKSGDPTPPPQASLDCDHVLEWMRMRPITKRCETDRDCVLQTDGCCDQTAVQKRYARICERTCDRRCPQDTLIGHQVQWVPVCEQKACVLKQITPEPTSAAPTKTLPEQATPSDATP